MKVSIHQASSYIEKYLIEYKIKKPLIIAIDGRSAAGKSTFAKSLQSRFDFPVIHTDDFFRPRDKDGNIQITEYCGNFDIERFKKEVIANIQSPLPFSYGVFDCSSGTITESRQVSFSKGRIVEGAYSIHPNLGNYADIKLFFDIDPVSQEQRIILRNGNERAALFKSIWIPAEERYIAHYDIISQSDLIINTEPEDNYGNL